MKRSEKRPSIALLLVHRYNKPAFVEQLTHLDEVCKSLPVGLFIYDAAYAQEEHIAADDVTRMHIPVRLLRGDIRSEIAAFNALFYSARYDFQWVLILDDVDLKPDWFEAVEKHLFENKIGVFGTSWDNISSVHSDVFPRTKWADKRFWLARIQAIQQVHGFDERYFEINAACKDFCWKAMKKGWLVKDIEERCVAEHIRQKYQMETRLQKYLLARNHWLFARLQLSLFQAIVFLTITLIIEGIGKKRLWIKDYRSGIRDGFFLLFR